MINFRNGTNLSALQQVKVAINHAASNERRDELNIVLSKGKRIDRACMGRIENFLRWNPRITMLSFRDYEWYTEEGRGGGGDDTAFTRLCTFLAEPTSCCCLSQLNLEGWSIGNEYLGQLVEAMRTNTSISRLNLRGNVIMGAKGGRLLGALLRHMDSPEALAISASRHLGLDGIREFFHALRGGQNLEKLRLYVSDCYLQEDEIHAMAEGLHGSTVVFHTLSLGGNNIPGRAILDFIRIAKCLRVQTLGLNFNARFFRSVRQVGSEVFFNAIYHSPIIELSLAGALRVCADGMRIVTTLLSNEKLQRLNLRWNDGLFDDIEAVTEFTDALTQNIGLRELDLGGCDIKGKPALILLQNIPNYQALHTLNLVQNNLFRFPMDEAYNKTLLQALRKMRLVRLACDVSWHALGHQEVVDALEDNTYVQDLSLSDPHDTTTQSSFPRIVNLLARNKALARARSLPVESPNNPTLRAVLVQSIYEFSQDSFGVSAVYEIACHKLVPPFCHGRAIPDKDHGVRRRRRHGRRRDLRMKMLTMLSCTFRRR